jgi:hypothetical protein
MQTIQLSVSKRSTVFLLALASVSLLWMGCGKKGPPRPPRRQAPPAITDLSYTLSNEMLQLNWTVPTADAHSASHPAAFKVLRSKMSVKDANCENCPLRFDEIGDVAIRPSESEGQSAEKIGFTETLEPGYRYTYKVIVYDKEGMTSPDSNEVKFSF